MNDFSLGLVLAVEDDNALRTAIRLNLVKRGYLVREAVTLRDALEAYDEVRPDVLLLDLNLPDGSGEDLLAELHRRGVVQPSIVMSAAGISPLRLADAQPVWYLAKPFRIEALLDVLALAQSARPAQVGADAGPERRALDLPAWARELRSACMTLSRASPRAVRSLALSLRVADAPAEVSPQRLATRLAGEYGLAAQAELADGVLRVWLRRSEGGAAADGQHGDPGETIQLSPHETRAGTIGDARGDATPVDGRSEV